MPHEIQGSEASVEVDAETADGLIAVAPETES